MICILYHICEEIPKHDSQQRKKLKYEYRFLQMCPYNVANVIKRRNNSLPEAIEVTEVSVDLIASIASFKQI